MITLFLVILGAVGAVAAWISLWVFILFQRDTLPWLALCVTMGVGVPAATVICFLSKYA